MPYCNCQHFYGTTIFVVWTIATITINITLLQILTLKCTMVIDNFLCTVTIDYFCMHYCTRQLFFGLLQLRTVACCRPALTKLVTLIAHKLITASGLVKLQLQLQMQNLTTESSTTINYNNSNNKHKLTTA